MVYNLGQQDLVVKELATKINDGKYHVIRFTRDGVNSTLQVDDNQVSRDSSRLDKIFLTWEKLYINNFLLQVV